MTDVESADPVLDPAPTYDICRQTIGPPVIDGALRLLHLDLLQRGASAQELGSWLWANHWFPHLKHDPAILALADGLPDEWRVGELCDPQILLQFPHSGPPSDVTFHVDEVPDWAPGRRYARIVGIPLSPWRPANGGVIIRSGERTIPLELDPGDAVRMDPDLPHSGGINTTGAIRYGIYLRWLHESSTAVAESEAGGG
jgi:hypothetical protein